ncbi:MAG: TonB-dependent receptor [Halioglobus sp.]
MKPMPSQTALPLLLTPLLTVGSVAWAETLALEEILVTAQKRTQNVQDIPITINVMDGDALDNYSIRNTNDLANFVPGLVIQAAPHNLSNITVRGLGTGAGSESYDQSVGLFIDGVYAGRLREFQSSLFDIERIEVIKGTQNSLLGKNTSLGAISIVSRKPGEELGGYLQADYEFEYDSVYTTGAIDIPTALGDFRVAFNQVAEGGYVENKTTGNEVPERDQTTLRLIGAFGIGSNGELTLSYQYDDLEIKGDSFQVDKDEHGILAEMDPGTQVGLDQIKTAYTSFGKGGDAYDEQTTERALVNYEHHWGDYSFTSLSSWSSYDNQRAIDSDFMSVDYLATTSDGDFSQFTQEFRLSSPVGERFDYVVGLFYLDSDYEFVNGTDTAFPPPYTLGGIPLTGASEKTFSQDTEVLSLFGQGTYQFSERWRATLGLRWTEEDKDAIFANAHLRDALGIGIISPLVEPTPLDRSEDNLDGSINLQYDLNDNTMLYTSWAKGSKSGGFSVQVRLPEEAEYDSEVAETIEVGAKLSLADGAALLNFAAFYTEIDDFQVVRFTGLGFETSSIPAESKGLELDGQWLLSEQWMLTGSATYADATETDTGQTLPQSPEWSASLGAHYENQLANSGLQFVMDGSLSYVDERYAHRGETFLGDAVTFLDLRLGIAPMEGRWELALVGRNLLDEEVSFGFDFPVFGGDDEMTTIAGLSRPLTIALQGRYNF